MGQQPSWTRTQNPQQSISNGVKPQIVRITHYGQRGFNPGVQGRINIWKLIGVIHHINELKKNHTVISTNAEKVFHKVQHPFRDTGIRGSFLSYQSTYKRPLQLTLHLVVGIVCCTRTAGNNVLNIVLEVPAGAVSQEKEIKGMEIGKEELNSLYLQMTRLSNYKISRTLQKCSRTNKWV